MKKILSREIIIYFYSVFNANQRMAIIKNCLIVLTVCFLGGYPYHQAAAITLAEYAQMQHMAEHKAVLDLVPTSAAKKQVLKSGAWSSPAIWSGGVLPKAGENILVPAGKSLFVDVESDVSLGTMRVDGTISFATNKNVRIKLDTLVVTETGAFEIGSESARVPAGNKVEIVIADHGPINRKWDPHNLSRGIIIQGKTRIFGAQKSAFHQLAIKPDAGSTQITLNRVPTGWAVGDIIAITATKFRNVLYRRTSYDELRSIKAISGATITLGQVDASSTPDPLKYSHVPNIPRMPVYAANLSRNVVISGEGGDNIPAGQRGHFMVMHNPDAIIKGAGFYYLGRTDKSKPIDDYKLQPSGWRLKDASGKFIPGPNNNPRGRYPVHFHHTGSTDLSVPPVICSGNAVFSSPGWGFVNHTSNVLMEDNASYNVFGSHYAAEDGNELGAFRRNIAIKAVGRGIHMKHGQGNHDVGHAGHGFWLESRNLVMESNVVSSVNDSGVAYWHRNEMPGMNLLILQQNLLTPNKGLTKNVPTIGYEKIPITYEKNTTVLASGGALDIIKGSPKQNHNVRSMIESFKAYSVVNGLGLQYTEQYTLKDIDIIADSVATRPWFRGVTLLPEVKDTVLVNFNISGFLHPVATGTTFKGKPDQTEAIFVNTKVDGRPINLSKDIHKLANAVQPNYNPSFQRVVNVPASLAIPGVSGHSTALNFKAENSLAGNFPISYNGGYLFKGTKIDSLGSTPHESAWGYYQLENTVRKGYYTDAAGNKYVLLKDLISDRLTGETREVIAKLKLLVKYKELGPLLGKLP